MLTPTIFTFIISRSWNVFDNNCQNIHIHNFSKTLANNIVCLLCKSINLSHQALSRIFYILFRHSKNHLYNNYMIDDYICDKGSIIFKIQIYSKFGKIMPKYWYVYSVTCIFIVIIKLDTWWTGWVLVSGRTWWNWHHK